MLVFKPKTYDWSHIIFAAVLRYLKALLSEWTWQQLKNWRNKSTCNKKYGKNNEFLLFDFVDQQKKLLGCCGWFEVLLFWRIPIYLCHFHLFWPWDRFDRGHSINSVNLLLLLLLLPKSFSIVHIMSTIVFNTICAHNVYNNTHYYLCT